MTLRRFKTFTPARLLNMALALPETQRLEFITEILSDDAAELALEELKYREASAQRRGEPSPMKTTKAQPTGGDVSDPLAEALTIHWDAAEAAEDAGVDEAAIVGEITQSARRLVALAEGGQASAPNSSTTKAQGADFDAFTSWLFTRSPR